MDRRLFALATAILVVACQASPPTTDPPPSFAPSARPTPTSPPSTANASPTFVPAAGPAMTVTLVGTEPIITPRDGPPDRVAVMPAAAAVDADGSIVAFLAWFGSQVGDQVVTVARSIDGRAWTIGSAPVDVDLGVALAPPGAVPGAAVRETDGTWLLYGWAAASTDRDSFETWRATAVGPEGPWTVADGEAWVLPAGPDGAWDDQTAAVSAILSTENGLELWYEGQRPGRSVRGGIGYATSTDGVTWVRRDGPVLGPGGCGQATAAAALGPQVWRRGDGYQMVFVGSASPSDKPDVLGATSEDGIHWSCTGTVLLGAADIPGSRGIESIQGVTLAGAPALLVESLTERGSEIWLATVAIGP